MMKIILKILIFCIFLVGTNKLSGQDWTVDPYSYEYSMNIIGKVSLSSSIVDQQNSYIGAFAGEECIGVAQPIPYSGGYQYFFLSVYSNSASGENINFRFLDDQGVVHSIANNILFSSDQILGSIESPFLWMDVEAYSPTDFISYSMPDQTGSAEINPDTQTITIEVANRTDLTNLIASFELAPGATTSITSIEQESGITVNNFSSPVEYLVRGIDGSTASWMVTVTEFIILSTENNILSFILMEQTGEADINRSAHIVNIEVTNGTDLSSLTPIITVSTGATINPASGVAQDFTNLTG